MGKVQRGDVITADLLNELGAGMPVAGIRATGGIDARQNPDGSIQISGKFTGCFVGIVDSGGISARSGTTAGTGNVKVQIKNPSSGDYVDSGLILEVDSISSTTGGVPSGTWVVCSFQDDGTPTLTTNDCGN
jgi:hypothetical protein